MVSVSLEMQRKVPYPSLKKIDVAVVVVEVPGSACVAMDADCGLVVPRVVF
jgi:hypothetical protein